MQKCGGTFLLEVRLCIKLKGSISIYLVEKWKSELKCKPQSEADVQRLIYYESILMDCKLLNGT